LHRFYLSFKFNELYRLTKKQPFRVGINGDRQSAPAKGVYIFILSIAGQLYFQYFYELKVDLLLLITISIQHHFIPRGIASDFASGPD
jgi:hypothetical protein